MLQTKIFSCASGPQLIFSCSGAADVGELADQTARKLTREGAGKMFCTAGIGGGITGIIEATKSAEKIIALDGCALSCTKHLLEKGGFANIDHVCITDLGFIKGQTALTEENIGKICEVVKERLTTVKLGV